MGAFQLLHRAQDAPALGKTRAHHEQHAAALRHQNAGIRHQIDGRRIENDVIIVLLQAVKQRFHAGGTEQFRRVGRHVAGKDDIKIFDAGIMDGLSKQLRLDKQVAQSYLFLRGQQTRQLGTAQVAVDQKDALLHLRIGDGKVECGDALSFGLHGGGHDQDLARRLVRQGKSHVGPQGLVGLTDEKIALFREDVFPLHFHDRGSIRRVVPPGSPQKRKMVVLHNALPLSAVLIGFLCAETRLFPLILRERGDLPQHGQVEKLRQVFLVLDANVHQIQQRDIDDREKQTHRAAQKGIFSIAWGIAARGHLGMVDDLGGAAFDKFLDLAGGDGRHRVGDLRRHFRIRMGDVY